MVGETCPVCNTLTATLQIVGPLAQQVDVDCPACGKFCVTDLALATIRNGVEKNGYLSAVLGYHIRLMQRQSFRPNIDDALAEEFLRRGLPSVAEQADNVVLWIGDNTKPAGILPMAPYKDYAIVGANLEAGMNYLIRGLLETGLVVGGGVGTGLGLTFEGWAKYQELKKGRASSRKAFMAMPFGDSRIDRVYSVFQGAVKSAGFELRHLDEKPEAGLIDNRLRVEIQTSRFLVVDLTNENRGAYSEGGFAEGLGKPVFYTCDKEYFGKQPTHFDANHQYTVLWSFDQLQNAATKLTNAVRATLPDEAKMTDD